VRAVHDPAAHHGLGPVGFDVHDDFDRTDHDASGDQHQEQRQRSGRVNGNGIDQRHDGQRNQESQPVSQTLDHRGTQRQRNHGSDGCADQCEAKRAFSDPHFGLHGRQPGEQLSENEGIDGKGRKDPPVRKKKGRRRHGTGLACDRGT